MTCLFDASFFPQEFLPRLYRTGSKSENAVQRAKSNCSSNCKYAAKNNEYQADCSGDKAAKVEYGKQCCNYEADNTVEVSYVGFHGCVV